MISVRRILAGVAVLGCVGLHGPARAQLPGTTREIVRAGLWSAYSGVGEDLRAACGIATTGADGRRIAVQQSGGETELDLLLDKPSWQIPDNTPVDIAVQFDNVAAQPDRATGSGQRVRLQMDFARSVPFMRALRYGLQLRVYFPGGNEAPWTGGLSGSSAAIDAFNDCRAALAPAAPTQPFRPEAAPTQPFAPRR